MEAGPVLRSFSPLAPARCAWALLAAATLAAPACGGISVPPPEESPTSSVAPDPSDATTTGGDTTTAGGPADSAAPCGCTDPPPGECSGTLLSTFVAPGTCDSETGACAYAAKTETCQYGCVDGACRSAAAPPGPLSVGAGSTVALEGGGYTLRGALQALPAGAKLSGGGFTVVVGAAP